MYFFSWFKSQEKDFLQLGKNKIRKNIIVFFIKIYTNMLKNNLQKLTDIGQTFFLIISKVEIKSYNFL